MTKVTSGGITIENGKITKGQEATATDLQNAFSSYTTELSMDGGLSQEDINEIQKLTGQFSQIYSELPVTKPSTTSSPSTTGSPSTTTSPSTSNELKPRNDGKLFNGLNDGHMASILQAKFTKSNDGKWTQDEINNCEKYLQEQGITDPPTQEQKDKLKSTLGVNGAPTPSTTPSPSASTSTTTTPSPSASTSTTTTPSPSASTSTTPSPSASTSTTTTPSPSASTSTTPSPSASTSTTTTPSPSTSTTSSPSPTSTATPLLDKLGNQFGVKDLLTGKFGGLDTPEEKQQAEEYLKKFNTGGGDGFDGIAKDSHGETAIVYDSEFDKLHKDLTGNKWSDANHVTKDGDKGSHTSYSYKDDSEIQTRLNDIGLYGGMGNQYGSKDKLNEKLAGAKSKEEANKILDEFKAFSSDSRLNGFRKETDDDGNMLVDKDSEADKLLKWLGIEPTYYDEYYD